MTRNSSTGGIAAVMAIILSGGVDAFAYEAPKTFSFHGTSEIDE